MRTARTVGLILSIALSAVIWPSMGADQGLNPQSHVVHDREGVSPQVALKRLMDGNQRFVAGRPHSPHRSLQRRAEVARGQQPFAIIVGCSDSRVPVEIVFDQGLGDLFVVRLAGNIVDDAALGSIEYAVDHLHARLIVVLGHDRCGAVEATLQGGSPPGHLGSLTSAIEPAVQEAKGRPGNPLRNAVNANIKHTVRLLRSSEPLLAGWVRSGRLKVAGARYELDTGKVAWLP